MWIRLGYCNQCGDCCRDYDVKGGAPEKVIGSCNMFSDKADGTGACVSWGAAKTKWSRGCNVWPTKPQHIKGLNRCSYLFIEVPKSGG